MKKSSNSKSKRKQDEQAVSKRAANPATNLVDESLIIQQQQKEQQRDENNEEQNELAEEAEEAYAATSRAITHSHSQMSVNSNHNHNHNEFSRNMQEIELSDDSNSSSNSNSSNSSPSPPHIQPHHHHHHQHHHQHQHQQQQQQFQQHQYHQHHYQPQAQQQSMHSTSPMLSASQLQLLQHQQQQQPNNNSSNKLTTSTHPTVQTVQPFMTSNKTSTASGNGSGKKATMLSSTSSAAAAAAAISSVGGGGATTTTPTSSICITQQLMKLQQPQKLDNHAIDALISEQIKAHLLLDDKEALQCKNVNEFIALFRTGVGGVLKPTAAAATESASSSSSSSSPASSSSSLSPQSSPSVSSASLASQDDKFVKCVSIFGNTGDGKSHTLNHTFFNGRHIFRTSDKQETCTLGVWCAYDPITNALIFDTEGLLGSTASEHERLRLLLKVLAVSDVVIYRTRAERLHNDLFKFLSDASVAYLKYFSKELKAAAVKLKLDTISLLGPCCVIFHETHHTDILCDEYDAASNTMRTVSHQLADRFAKLDLSYNAFSLIEYVGVRTTYPGSSSASASPSSSLGAFVSSSKPASGGGGTDFTKLALGVRDLLRNNSVRQPRKLSSIYHVLKVLNDKFNGKIVRNQMSTFADEYFTCTAVCLSCGKRCQNSINHLKDSILHESSEKCQYDHQYDNKVYVCKLCHESGKEVIVIPKTAASNDNSLVGIVKYTCSGYVLECPHHGIIYRSRQYWYGNPDPETVVRTELKHIWNGQQNNVGTSHNLSRKIIDNVSYIGESIQSVSAKPTMLAKQWMADQVAPTYWVPNSEIVACHSCHKEFVHLLEKKHHCRGCGKGFCDKCSAKRKVIVWWSPTEKVRVCDLCFLKEKIDEPKQPAHMANTVNPYSSNTSNNTLSSLGISGNNDVIARKVTETVQETIGLITYATKIPFDVLKESARPSYWRPDAECLACSVCKKPFDDLLLLHHCRSCGNGVCNACSPHLRPVPSRGWETPVRVCNNCVSNEAGS